MTDPSPDSAIDRSSQFYHNLAILPPLQRQDSTPILQQQIQDAILLPPIQATEPVASIRSALIDVQGYAHMTQFKLVLENDSKLIQDLVALQACKHELNGHGKSNKARDRAIDTIISPYTSSSARIQASTTWTGLEEAKTKEDMGEKCLHDLDDLTSLASKGQLQSNASYFQMVLQRYDLGAVKDHVARLRFLLDGNIPTITHLWTPTTNTAVDEPLDKQEVNKSETAPSDTSKLTDSLPPLPNDQAVSIDGKDLSRYFYLAFGEKDWADFVSLPPPRQDTISTDKPSDTPTQSSELSNRPDYQLFRTFQQQVQRRYQLESACRIPCTITFGGFNPPTHHRRLLGDIAYLEIVLPQHVKTEDPASFKMTGSCVVHVTSSICGFYINRTEKKGGSPCSVRDTQYSNASTKKQGLVSCSNDWILDPRPADEPCFSHTLLDCLLMHSKAFRSIWARALSLASERSEILSEMLSHDNAYQGLFRSVIRADVYDPDSMDSSSYSSESLYGEHVVDSVSMKPSWIIPAGRSSKVGYGGTQAYHVWRASDYIHNTYGFDFRNSPLRDWNEELQSARDMPKGTLQERMDRAKVIHKVLGDFTDASLMGTMAIYDGQLTPMNPNEPTRSHVYMHNNIFFSRAVDSGIDTFKVAQGDMCARKMANRDVNCVQTLHKLDVKGMNTLATILVDYLGHRFLCQSIVPGILQGEKNHAIVYGAVEASSPLAWDPDFHHLLEDTLGLNMMVASRPLPTLPFSNDCSDLSENHTEEHVLVCGPVEMKGIKGSDQRTYCLDVTRLTPRDANWVAQEDGGTGNWEELMTSVKLNRAQKQFMPSSLSDDEWLAAVLRPELIRKFSNENGQKTKEEKEAIPIYSVTDSTVEAKEGVIPNTENASSVQQKQVGTKLVEMADQSPGETSISNHNPKIAFNVNVFIPRLEKPFNEVPGLRSQWEKDEEIVRNVSSHLWKDIIPALTNDVRNNHSLQIPTDGKSLTQLIHGRGINCRYLGRLASLAIQEEVKDRQEAGEVTSGQKTGVERSRMPLCWLELIECEIVARSAKHVLNRYLSESLSVTGVQPLVIVSSFLSAIMSTSEEGAADTENRLVRQRQQGCGSDGFSDLNIPSCIFIGDQDSDSSSPRDILLRCRHEIWEDMNREIGRRFRYSLTLYNSKNEASKNRALMIPLLRRICQIMGIRLISKNYQVGGRCYCGGSLTTALMSFGLIYPISPSDIVNIVPMIKHAGFRDEESFVPYIPGSGTVSSFLHILLPDAKIAFDTAQVHLQSKVLPSALEAIQEANVMYQKVVESPLHVQVAACLETTAIILFEAQEYELACVTAIKALALLAQVCGLDSHEVTSMHVTAFHIFYSVGDHAKCVQHLRAAIYLMELQSGPHYIELSNLYQRFGVLYYEKGQLLSALRLYQEATGRFCRDLVVEGAMVKSCANILASLSHFKAAVEMEKRAHALFVGTLGPDHELSKSSATAMQQLMAIALVQGNRQLEENKRRMEEEAADSIASQIKADLDAEENNRKKANMESKKKKKNKKKK